MTRGAQRVQPRASACSRDRRRRIRTRWAATGLALGTAALLLSGLATAAEPAEADGLPLIAASGQLLYQRHCSACHGDDGRGDGPVAAALRMPPANLRTIRRRRDGDFPIAELARTIDGRLPITAHGPRDMPVWGLRFSENIVEDEIAEEVVRGNISALIDYLATLQDDAE